MKYLVVLALACAAPCAFAGQDEAQAYLQAGNYEAAAKEYSSMADAGDARAMVTVGNLYYEGQGLPQDYGKAMDWWLRAFDHNGDSALTNIGVLYRDGKGVPQNLKVAYDIFVIVHMRGWGSLDTQYRNGSNLQKTIAAMTPEEIKDALCYSEEYVLAYVKSKGNVPPAQPLVGKPIKDREWWLDGELPKFDCAAASAP